MTGYEPVDGIIRAIVSTIETRGKGSYRPKEIAALCGLTPQRLGQLGHRYPISIAQWVRICKPGWDVNFGPAIVWIGKEENAIAFVLAQQEARR